MLQNVIDIIEIVVTTLVDEKSTTGILMLSLSITNIPILPANATLDNASVDMRDATIP